jgi:hypothetical protein
MGKKDANGNLAKTPKARPGVTLNRRDLHAIPVPSAKLLWKNLHTHEATGVGKDRKTSNIFIGISVSGMFAICSPRSPHPSVRRSLRPAIRSP